ncbi:MAG: 30S ribosomal protein S9 [bacterium]|nr:30S ribosomal protein S9 [bacterium]
MKEIKQSPKQKKEFIFAVGRRKESVARVRLYEAVREDLMWGTVAVKKGDILVNQKPITEYFNTETMRHIYSEPLRVANVQNKFTFTIAVSGGGKAGQLGAAVHGIARVLSILDSKNHRPVLKKKGFLTRDPRTRERRMVGTGGKARRAKQSPKR